MANISVSLIKGGDIIRVPSPTKNGSEFSPFYVHYVHYDGPEHVRFLEGFELKSHELKKRLPEGNDTVQITGLENKNALGLNPNKNYTVHVDRRRLNNTPEQLGGKQTGKVNKLGSLAGTQYERDIFKSIDRLGGEAAVFGGAEQDPAKFARARDLDTLAPFHKQGGDDNKPDFDQQHWNDTPKGYKKARKTKYGIMGPVAAGQVIDIDLEDAGRLLDLDDALIEAFTEPGKKSKLLPLQTLRQVFELADKSPQEFKKYLPDYNNFLIEDFEAEKIINKRTKLSAIFYEPLNPKTKTIETLREAADALSAGGASYFKQFKGVDDKKAQEIAKQITKASEYVSELEKDNIDSIKSAWSAMVEDYLKIKKGNNDLSEAYDKGNGELAIYLRPK